jgi:hypothetical protein
MSSSSELNQYYVRTAIPGAPQHTGFVPNIADPVTQETQGFRSFHVYKEEPALGVSTPFKFQAIQHIHTRDPLNQAFFSVENIKLLQDEIRYSVWVKSGNKHVIDPQDEDALKIIMRSYYLQYAPYDPSKTREELDTLNTRVIAYCSDKIMCEINQYLYYIKDIQDFPAPIENPTNASIKGTRTPEFKRFF